MAALKAASAGTAAEEPSDPRRRDPLNATPVVVSGVGAQRDGGGLVQIRREAVSKSRVMRFLAEKLNFRRVVRVNLDEHGSAFWEQIDGTRTLHAIERSLRQRFGLERRESETAVVEFTKSLMLRGLIGLQVPGQTPTGERDDGRRDNQSR